MSVAANIILSRQTFCHDKHTFVMFVAIDIWRDKSFIASKCFCGNKHAFVATKDFFCREKHVFVATKMRLVAAPAKDNVPHPNT